MNILQICTKVPFPPKDGGAAAVYAISSSLAELGHQVTILAANPPKHYSSTVFSKPLPKGITIIPVDINTNITLRGALLNLLFSGQPYHVARFNKTVFHAKLKELLTANKYDIIQFEGIYLWPLQRTIKKFGDTKTGLRAHNIEHKLWEDITTRTQNPLKKLYLRIQTRRLKKFEYKIIRDVPFLLPISANDDLYFSEITSASRHVVPFGIDINAIPEIKKINRLNDLFYLGALDWIPNQDALQWFITNIWPAILKDYPDLTFHIAGRNAPLDFRNKVSQHQNIVFHGEVDDAGEFMRDHSLMIVPLFSGSGLRVKIIEALFNGIPVIASPKAIEGLPVEHEKNILIAGNASAYCEIIGKIRSGKINLEQLQLNGRNFVTENFNNLVLAKELVQFYQSVI